MIMHSIKVDCAGRAEVINTGFCGINEFCTKNIGPKCETPEFVHPKRLPRPYAMVVDESGLYHDLKINLVASYLYQMDIHGCPIVGDVLFMKDIMTAEGPDIGFLNEQDVMVLTAILSKHGARFNSNDKEGE